MKNKNVMKVFLLLMLNILVQIVICDSIVPVDTNTYTSKIEKLVI
jgi:hypothetical protein